MDYREELARRLERVPFSARQIAALAGVSAAWVSKAKKRQAHKITLETSQRIHAAIDKLADQARSMPAPPAVKHPGIEALAVDSATLTRYGITPDELDLLCGGIYPVTITEKRDALDLLLVNLRAGPRSKAHTRNRTTSPYFAFASPVIHSPTYALRRGRMGVRGSKATSPPRGGRAVCGVKLLGAYSCGW